ncbi:hypothetical protein C0971_08965 [Bacillus methanolicus]|nr:hypothetical protein C0971_08965 [Bacillus methanolicus]
MWWALNFIFGIIIFGFLVDWWYKRKGMVVDPEENAKHVSDSERVYIESHMHKVKNDFDKGPF